MCSGDPLDFVYFRIIAVTPYPIYDKEDSIILFVEFFIQTAVSIIFTRIFSVSRSKYLFTVDDL